MSPLLSNYIRVFDYVSCDYLVFSAASLVV